MPEETPQPGSRPAVECLQLEGQAAADLQRLGHGSRAWLLESPIVTPGGGVLSWLNPEKPGYVYPEIMGYYVGFAAAVLSAGEDAGHTQQAGERGALVARALVKLAELDGEVPRGAIGRGSVAYVFDTCIALNGLIDFARASGEDPHRAAIGRMADFVDSSLTERAFAWESGHAIPDPESWSLSFGASALKTALALHRAAQHLERPELAKRADAVVVAVCAECWSDGAFRINTESEWVYAHAHSYALEGLLYLRTTDLVPDGPVPDGPGGSGQIDVERLLRAGTAWSSERQNPDGSLTGWHGRKGAADDHQGDATAQSVRLWSAVDAKLYADSIERGLAFLSGLQQPCGGLVYNAGSTDLNSWVTIFAWQAADWLLASSEPDYAGVL